MTRYARELTMRYDALRFHLIVEVVGRDLLRTACGRQLELAWLEDDVESEEPPTPLCARCARHLPQLPAQPGSDVVIAV